MCRDPARLNSLIRSVICFCLSAVFFLWGNSHRCYSRPQSWRNMKLILNFYILSTKKLPIFQPFQSWNKELLLCSQKIHVSRKIYTKYLWTAIWRWSSTETAVNKFRIWVFSEQSTQRRSIQDTKQLASIDPQTCKQNNHAVIFRKWRMTVYSGFANSDVILCHLFSSVSSVKWIDHQGYLLICFIFSNVDNSSLVLSYHLSPLFLYTYCSIRVYNLSFNPHSVPAICDPVMKRRRCSFSQFSEFRY